MSYHYTFSNSGCTEISGKHMENLGEEVGKVFAKVLEHAGVYKCTSAGKAAFSLFVE